MDYCTVTISFPTVKSSFQASETVKMAHIVQEFDLVMGQQSVFVIATPSKKLNHLPFMLQVFRTRNLLCPHNGPD